MRSNHNETQVREAVRSADGQSGVSRIGNRRYGAQGQDQPQDGYGDHLKGHRDDPKMQAEVLRVALARPVEISKRIAPVEFGMDFVMGCEDQANTNTCYVPRFRFGFVQVPAISVVKERSDLQERPSPFVEKDRQAEFHIRHHPEIPNQLILPITTNRMSPANAKLL